MGAAMFGAVPLPVNAQTPAITSISPASATVGSQSMMITVNGTDFESGSIVKFDGMDLSTTYVSATQLTANLPASQLIATGPSSVMVSNPGGENSNSMTFTTTAGLPDTGFRPNNKSMLNIYLLVAAIIAPLLMFAGFKARQAISRSV